MSRHRRVDDVGRWWLNLQVSFGLAGAATWLAGVYFEQTYVSGVGTGLVVAALLLRLARPDDDEAVADSDNIE